MVWSAIKGAIFEEDPSEKAAKAAGAPTPTTHTNAASPAGVAAAMSVMSGSNANPEFIAAIRKAVFSKPTALTSLVTAADSLAEIIPDQTTRFKAAFKTSGAGRTVQQIVSAADIHLADIEGEELRFKAAIDSKLGAEIQTHEQQAKVAAQNVQATQQLIENLQRQMMEAQARIGELTAAQADHTAKANAKRAELEQTSAQFKAASDAVRNEIVALRQTVTSALS
jgi:chromosome segregation ATPase